MRIIALIVGSRICSHAGAVLQIEQINEKLPYVSFDGFLKDFGGQECLDFPLVCMGAGHKEVQEGRTGGQVDSFSKGFPLQLKSLISPQGPYKQASA